MYNKTEKMMFKSRKELKNLLAEITESGKFSRNMLKEQFSFDNAAQYVCDSIYEIIKEDFAIEDCVLTGRGVRVYGQVNLNEFLKKIIDNGIIIDSVVCCQSSIEDYYLSLIGGGNHA